MAKTSVALGGGELTISHGDGALSVFDAESGRFIDVNDAWCSLYEYTLEEARSLQVSDVSAEPDASRAAMAAARDTGGVRIPIRWQRKKSGVVFPTEMTVGLLRDGERRYFFARIEDITDRLRAEESARSTDASFRALIEGIPDAVIVHQAGKLVYLNPAARVLLGYGEDEVVEGRPGIEIVHPDDRPQVYARVAEMSERGVRAPPREERLLRRNGEAVWVEIVAMPVQFGGRSVIVAIARDLTARKEMESRLVTADRLASLGRLAASVGHEINNPLAYVLGSVELLRRSLSRTTLPDDLRMEISTRVDAIEDGAARVRDIVRDLKTLSRDGAEVRAPVDVNRILEVCANMADHEIRHRATLVREYGAGVIAHANEGRLSQVFLNLLLNAAQAVPEGEEPERHEVRVVSRMEEGRVVVEVHDTGEGIPEELADRIFEPFFTTKSPGKGTGLGLSICHHIVTALGGTITSERRVPTGTCFRVTLPPALDAPTRGRHS
ncbi:MAG: PAS domain S-box protein [Polyangiales bacterium]